MPDLPPTPDKVLIDFLLELPDTIRGGIVYQCGFGMGIEDLVVLYKEENIIVELRGRLDVEGAMREYRCAQLIGVLELVLEPDLKDVEKLNTELYEETKVTVFRDIALRQPLARKHIQVARERFQELRQAGLSPRSLQAWQSLHRLSDLPEAEDE